MQASDRQQAVYNAWETTDHNLLIGAVAGSGKTTTLLELLRRCDRRTLFLAFNKSIQEEIQGIIDSRGLQQGKAMTMHALGLSAIRKHTKFKINSKKGFEMVKKVQDMNHRRFNTLTWEKKVRLTFTLLDFNDVSRIYLTDDMEQIIHFMEQMDKSYYEVDWLEEVWQDMLSVREEYHAQRVLEVDFHDMIFIPIQKDLEIPVYCTYLMIDEAQDLNLAQHRLIDKLIGQGHIQRWIAVGDRNQSIYGFTGAYASSFDRFAQKENTISLPLDICYRCPVSVINSANEVYNVMEGFKREEGIVDTLNDYTLIKEGSMVICRNTAPLFELYFQLLSEGRKVVLKGEDIIPMVKKFLKPHTYKDVNTTVLKLQEELVDLEAKKDHSDHDRMRYHWFKQQFANVQVLVRNLVSPGDKINDLFNRIDSTFQDDEQDAIVLCTIHKSKGLEADVVYILNEHLIPSKFAISDQQLKQERNLKYVARTRAKEELYFLNL